MENTEGSGTDHNESRANHRHAESDSPAAPSRDNPGTRGDDDQQECPPSFCENTSPLTTGIQEE
jgi:hypothetical protein